jgi:hypothetical protein
MGTMDAMIVPVVEQEQDTLPTLQLMTAAGAFAGAARAKAMTDIEAFARSVDFAIQARNGLTPVILDDLRRVLIGDSWTEHGRNHGDFALKFNSFLDTGFKKEFRDDSNQVQHAMAGIYIRGTYGLFASMVPYWMEDGKADLALYEAAFEIGDMLNLGHSVHELPDLIRTRLGA